MMPDLAPCRLFAGLLAQIDLAEIVQCERRHLEADHLLADRRMRQRVLHPYMGGIAKLSV